MKNFPALSYLLAFARDTIFFTAAVMLTGTSSVSLCEARFTDIERTVVDDNHTPRTMNKAGFREKNHEGNLEYYCYPEVFKAEICKGFDHRAVARLLIDRGYMRPGDSRNLATKKRLPGEGSKRVFHVLPTIWSEQND